MSLTVENRLDRAVGIGLGFHPWLPRHAGGRLYAPAKHVWMSGADAIPVAAEAGLHRLDVESACDQYILYAPANQPFFCFEPITHKPSPGQSGQLDGLVMVQPGGSLHHAARFAVTGP